MAQQHAFIDFKLPNDIRLLAIHSRENAIPLQGSISEHPLGEDLAYEALSYAWGFPESQDESPLRRLREPDIARVMWIDRVCINQANKEERNAQVAIMPDIYRGATRVMPWIGERTYDSDQALLFLKEMAMQEKYNLRHNWRDGERLGSDTKVEGMKEMSDQDVWNKMLEDSKQHGHIITGVPLFYTSAYHPLFENAPQADWEALGSRPWWSRTWVKTVRKAMQYQEAWDDMGCLVRGTKRWEIWATLKRQYGPAVHISQKRLLGSKLSDLPWNIWDRDATDPRDKVFAVLGLVGKEYGDALPGIAYSKSVEQIYQEAASFIITKERSLDLLLATSGLHSQATSAEALSLNGHGYSASGQLAARISFSDNLSVLSSYGLIFNNFSEVSTNCGNLLCADIIIQRLLSMIKKRLRRFFITRGGHFCIGPSTTRPGDVVSFLAGCNFPIAYVPNYIAREILKDHPSRTAKYTKLSLG
ncbi:HET domain-containing protein [Trichoderma novae-zelandiae]